MRFFFDNNLAIKLAHGLHQMVSPHHRVVHLRDEFLPNVEDATWMRALGKEEDLVIVTADMAISRNPHIASINVPAMESHALGSAISKATINWGSASREERIMTHYFLFSFFSCRRTLGTNIGQESLIRRCGLDGDIASKILSQRSRVSCLVAGSTARVFARIPKVPFRHKADGRARQLERLV